METVSGVETAFALWELAGAVDAFRRESLLSTSNGPFLNDTNKKKNEVRGESPDLVAPITGRPLLAPPGGARLSAH